MTGYIEALLWDLVLLAGVWKDSEFLLTTTAGTVEDKETVFNLMYHYFALARNRRRILTSFFVESLTGLFDIKKLRPSLGCISLGNFPDNLPLILESTE